jgi:hypothetical protein
MYEASSDVSRMSGDTAVQLQNSDDLRDEAVYLKVKLRKGSSVSQ